MGLTDNNRGAAWMTLSMLAFTLNDTCMKRVGDELPIFQAVFLRGFPLVIVLWLVMRASGGSIRQVSFEDRALAARVVMEMGLLVAFLLTLIKVPIGALAAIVQLVPLVVAFAAARLLHERVSVHRVGALLAGFVGVLLVIQPWSDGFNPWFVLGLVTVGLVVVRELATRRIRSDVPSPVIAFVTAVATSALGGVLSIVQGWERPGQTALLLVLGAAGCISVAHLASVTTIRVGDLSFSALFRQTSLLFAIVLQIVVFNDIPDRLTVVGCLVILAAGLWAVSREYRGATSKVTTEVPL